MTTKTTAKSTKSLPKEKKPPPVRKPSKEATPRMKAYARGVVSGKTKKQAAIDAGVPPKCASSQAAHWDADARLQEFRNHLESLANVPTDRVIGLAHDLLEFNVLDYLPPDDPDRAWLESTGVAHRLKKFRRRFTTVTKLNTKGKPVSSVTTGFTEIEGPDVVRIMGFVGKVRGMEKLPATNPEDQAHYDKMVADAMEAARLEGKIQTPEDEASVRRQIILTIRTADTKAEGFLLLEAEQGSEMVQ